MKGKEEKYKVVHTHRYFVGIENTQAPQGAKYVRYWNDEKHLAEAKIITKRLNDEQRSA